MLVVVLDYTDGSVHFHKIPKKHKDKVEDYLTDVLDYLENMIHWMEVKC